MGTIPIFYYNTTILKVKFKGLVIFIMINIIRKSFPQFDRNEEEENF
jgi:hypothetical protein